MTTIASVTGGVDTHKRHPRRRRPRPCRPARRGGIVPDHPPRLPPATAVAAVPWRPRRGRRRRLRLVGRRPGPLPRRPRRTRRRGQPTESTEPPATGQGRRHDAEAAARAVLSGDAPRSPRQATGPSRHSASSGWPTTAPSRPARPPRTRSTRLRHRSRLGARPAPRSVARQEGHCVERWRPGHTITLEIAAKRALVSVARRWRALDAEIRQLDLHIKAIQPTRDLRGTSDRRRPLEARHHAVPQALRGPRAVPAHPHHHRPRRPRARRLTSRGESLRVQGERAPGRPAQRRASRLAVDDRLVAGEQLYPPAGVGRRGR